MIFPSIMNEIIEGALRKVFLWVAVFCSINRIKTKLILFTIKSTRILSLAIKWTNIGTSNPNYLSVIPDPKLS